MNSANALSSLPKIHPAGTWEALADALGTLPALCQGERSVSWRDFEQRAARLATAFTKAGLGPGDTIAIDLYNCNEWMEVFFAAMKVRCVPANVNYRYLDRELVHLLSDSGARALVFHASLTETVQRALHLLPKISLLVRVADGIGPTDPLPGVHELEDLIAMHAPAARIERQPDDQYLSYTGGTTGLPKGVMVNMSRLGNSMFFIGPALGITPEQLADPLGTAVAAAEGGQRVVAIPASPIMHSTGFGMAATPALNYGGTVVTLCSRSFDPSELLDAVERRSVNLVTMVGDAMARPLVRAMQQNPERSRARQLGSLRVIASAGVAWSGEAKAALFDFLPEVSMLDSCGASEGITYGSRIYRKGDDLSGTHFVPAPGLMILDEHGHPQPNRPGITGLLANSATAVGYFNDPQKSASTYREINGTWCAVPGDYGRLEESGLLTLLGRRSNTINTGGEKVYPEEVEDVLRAMPGLEDCLVFSMPDERFGQRVAALIEVRNGQALEEAHVLQHVRHHLAGYKMPRVLKFVAKVPRAPNGKADYVAARALMASADR